MRSDRFSKAFRSLLTSLLDAGADVSAVHDVITVMRRQMLACLDPDLDLRARAEDMFQEVRLITREALERVQAGRRARTERIASVLAMTSVELAAVRSEDELRAVVGKRFAELGVLSCYVAVFENRGSSAQMRLLVAYNSEAPHLESVGATFPSAALAPDSWLPRDRSPAHVVTSVHFCGQKVGLLAGSPPNPTRRFPTPRGTV